MHLTSAEGYQDANIAFLTIKTINEIWVSMKDIGSGIGVKNISDLVLKEIHGICETKNPTKEQVNEYKMTERKIYKKFDNLSEKELNTKNNKKAYVRSNVMTTIIKRFRGEKTRDIRAIDGFRKKIMIPDSEIPKCPEFEVKSKIGKIFKKHSPLEEYYVRIYEIDPLFYKHYQKNPKKQKQVDRSGCKYILFRKLMFILIIFYQQQKLVKKGILTEILFLKKKEKKHQKKKRGCSFIRINTSNAKNGYDLDYLIGNIEAFIDEFKNEKIKELEDKIKTEQSTKFIIILKK